MENIDIKTREALAKSVHMEECEEWNCLCCERLNEDIELCDYCCRGNTNYEDDHFIPDDWYIENVIASCRNCRHVTEDSFCQQCKRHYNDDLWEWDGK